MNDDSTQLWMVPYADLMTTLVLLFMALFGTAYSRLTAEERAIFNDQVEQITTAAQTAPNADIDRIKHELGRLKLDEFGVRVTSRQIRFTLPSPVLFGEGSDRLSPDAQAVLAPLTRLFAKCANPILVDGYTDDVRIVGGRFRSNWELSAARSFAIVKFLMSQGLEPQRFQARGYGQYRPVASNLTPEGRGLNRRIEISLIRETRKED
jgi:chemotaxis protein MotB